MESLFGIMEGPIGALGMVLLYAIGAISLFILLPYKAFKLGGIKWMIIYFLPIIGFFFTLFKFGRKLSGLAITGTLCLFLAFGIYFARIFISMFFLPPAQAKYASAEVNQVTKTSHPTYSQLSSQEEKAKRIEYLVGLGVDSLKDFIQEYNLKAANDPHQKMIQTPEDIHRVDDAFIKDYAIYFNKKHSNELLPEEVEMVITYIVGKIGKSQ